jgi:hypothetical protein
VGRAGWHSGIRNDGHPVKSVVPQFETAPELFQEHASLRLDEVLENRRVSPFLPLRPASGFSRLRADLVPTDLRRATIAMYWDW